MAKKKFKTDLTLTADNLSYSCISNGSYTDIFSIKQDPSTLDSVQLVIAQDDNSSSANNTGPGGYKWR